jgi:hypothetical protein
MKHRQLSLQLLVFILLFSLAVPASATPATESNTIQLESFNEYDYIELLQTSSPQELEEIGISEQEAMTVISEFEDALLDRASLSDSELESYGYDDSEIALFHALTDGETLSSAEIRSLGSTCEGEITRHSFTETSAKFSYTFTWDRCPIMTLSDSAAMRWIAYDSTDEDIGVEPASSSMRVEYHFKGNASSDGSPAFAHYGNPTSEPNLDFNTMNMQFPVYEPHTSDNGIIFDCYAKTGTVTVTVKLPKGSATTLHHIFVGGLYGHTLVGVGSPSVSVNEGSIAISFTGNTSTDPIASRKATIYKATTEVEYWKD